MSNVQNGTAENGNKGALIARFASRMGVDQGQLLKILKATCFKLPRDRNYDGPPPEVSNEQMAALLIVAEQFGLNPFLRQIFAFPDKVNGITPVIGVDGWIQMMNDCSAFDGIEFHYGPEATPIDNDHKPCPEWIEAVIYRTDRSRPTVIREFLRECYRPAFEGTGRNGPYKKTGEWQIHTSRMLRHKALIQCARVALGLGGGAVDEDEAGALAFQNLDVIDVDPEVPLAQILPGVVALLPDGTDPGLVEQFINAIASRTGRNAVGVARAALEDDSFAPTFQRWAGKQIAPEAEPQQKPKPSSAGRQKSAPKADPKPAGPASTLDQIHGLLLKKCGYGEFELDGLMEILRVHLNDQEQAELRAGLVKNPPALAILTEAQRRANSATQEQMEEILTMLTEANAGEEFEMDISDIFTAVCSLNTGQPDGLTKETASKVLEGLRGSPRDLSLITKALSKAQAA
ncbi:MAG: recombinase RecT [Deltaproteobacteria bacterium]|nr:recombinase RecT [Deltaproteobacteria bacterium]